MHQSVVDRPRSNRESRDYFLRLMEAIIDKALNVLQRTQERYKKEFDRRVLKEKERLRPNDFVYLEVSNSMRKPLKLENPDTGPFRVLAADKRLVCIDHDGVVERMAEKSAVYAPLPAEPVSRGTDDLMPTEADLRAKRKEGPE